jgi:3-carboxy-cis,cis-muconate cycloisomerase
MALAARLGKQEAHHVVQAACERAVQRGTDLETVARADERIGGVLSPDEIGKALDPSAYLGSADLFVDRALTAFQEVAGLDAVPVPPIPW